MVMLDKFRQFYKILQNTTFFMVFKLRICYYITIVEYEGWWSLKIDTSVNIFKFLYLKGINDELITLK